MKVENNFTFFTIEIDYLHFVHHVAILVTYWVLQFVQTAWTLSERSLHLLLSRKLFFPMIWHIVQGNEANRCYLWGSTAVRLRIWVLWCDTDLLGKWLSPSSGTKVYCLFMKMTVTQYFKSLGATHPSSQCHICQGLNPKQSVVND